MDKFGCLFRKMRRYMQGYGSIQKGREVNRKVRKCKEKGKYIYRKILKFMDRYGSLYGKMRRYIQGYGRIQKGKEVYRKVQHGSLKKGKEVYRKVRKYIERYSTEV